MIGSAATTLLSALCNRDGSFTTSSRVCPGMARHPPSSKIAAVITPVWLICPSFILVFEVNGLVVAVEFHGRGPLFLGSETRILGAAERKLILHTGAGQVDGQQARFRAVNILERAREIGGLDGRRKPERN